MKIRTLLAPAALSVPATACVHAQRVDSASTSGTTRVMSGTVRPTRPPKADLGFGWRSRTGEPFILIGVRPDSPASRAGLMNGDALVAIDGRDPGEPEAFFPNLAPGRHYRLRIQRGDRELELELVAGPPRPLAAQGAAPTP